jgi:wobble nucleotide-excising tRNase
MVEKIISIKNIGRFRDCSPRGDVSFKKLTLLFAENGRGKTTLCAILRSLQTGQPEYIGERQTLGSINPPSVQIRLGGNTLTFGTNRWSSIHPDIAIFDSVFVHDNVYAGDFVEHEHKKNLYRVIVGAGGVQLANQIEQLDAKIRDANTNIRNKKDSASKSVPSGTTLETYLTWQPIDDINTKIEQKAIDMAYLQRTLDKASEIQSKGLLTKIWLPSFPAGFLTILSKQLKDVISDAEASVRQQIHLHNMGRQGETWISQGLGFVVDDKCPFCGQALSANELFAAYRSHFNIAYTRLKQEVAQLSHQISNAIGETSLNVSQQTHSNNLLLIEFWKQFAEIDLPAFDIEDVRSKYTTLRERASMLAQRKQLSPTEPIIPDDEFQTALDGITSLQASVDTYNTAVDMTNAIITEQKVTVRQGADIIALK